MHKILFNTPYLHIDVKVLIHERVFINTLNTDTVLMNEHTCINNTLKCFFFI